MHRPPLWEDSKMLGQMITSIAATAAAVGAFGGIAHGLWYQISIVAVWRASMG